MRSFRGLRYFLAPPWLTGKGDGEKAAFTLEWLLDAFLEKIRQGLNARFPSRAGESALNLIIGDRGLLRGRNESAADLVTRLKAWRTPRTHRVRGNAYEAALQVWQYWREADGTGTYVDIVDAHGVTTSIEADGSDDRQTFLWDWDGLDPDVHWSRFWVELFEPGGAAPTPDFGDAALWGGSIGAAGYEYVLGLVNVTPADISAMRVLFQDLKWNPAHAVPMWLIIVPVGGLFPTPDEDYVYWSKDDGGTRVAARSTAARYVALGPAVAYAGDRSRPWPAATEIPHTVGGDETYAGDRSNVSAFDATTLPGGASYAGSRTRFPNRVPLPDDGTVVR